MTAVPIDPHRLAEVSADWLNAGADDEHLGARLAAADTSIQVRFGDGVGFTAYFDRRPIEAEPELLGSTEIVLDISPELFLGLITREEQLGMLVMERRCTYSGPIRKFLRIVPMLRALDYSMWRPLLADLPKRAPEAPAS